VFFKSVVTGILTGPVEILHDTRLNRKQLYSYAESSQAGITRTTTTTTTANATDLPQCFSDINGTVSVIDIVQDRHVWSIVI